MRKSLHCWVCGKVHEIFKLLTLFGVALFAALAVRQARFYALFHNQGMKFLAIFDLICAIFGRDLLARFIGECPLLMEYSSDFQTVCHQAFYCVAKTVKNSICKLSKFPFSNCQNFSFQTVKIFPFQTVKIFPFQTVKISLSKLSKFPFPNCQNFPFQTVKIFPFQTVKNL